MQYADLIAMGLAAAAIAPGYITASRGDDDFSRARATLFSMLAFYVAGFVALVWSRLLADVHLFDGAALGTWGGMAVGVVLYELAYYAWHRAAHRWQCLWRAAHQLHHSAERLDPAAAFFLHPLEVVVLTSLRSLVFFALLGLQPGAGLAGALCLTAAGLLQHTRIRTPRWLGYIVQRPESHSLHHQRGVHACNYAHLPLVDMLFGTFRNPREFSPEQGFYPGASERVGEMLLMRDIGEARRAG